MSYSLVAENQTVVFYVTHVDGCDHYRFFLRYTEDTAGENMLLYQYDVTSTTDFTVSYNGVMGRSYTGNVYYRASEDDSWSIMGAQTVVTDGVSLWSWTDSSARVTAYNAVTNKGLLTDFSYAVWNELCDKVLEVVEYKDDTWDTSYGTLNDTYMSSSDKEMTAKRFNAVLKNINKFHSTGVSIQSPGDIIYGSYFTKITDAINYIANEDN